MQPWLFIYLRCGKQARGAEHNLGSVSASCLLPGSEHRSSARQTSWSPYSFSDQNLWFSRRYFRLDPNLQCSFQTWLSLKAWRTQVGTGGSGKGEASPRVPKPAYAFPFLYHFEKKGFLLNFFQLKKDVQVNPLLRNWGQEPIDVLQGQLYLYRRKG